MSLALKTVIALTCVAFACAVTAGMSVREGALYQGLQSSSDKQSAKRPQKESPEGERYYVLGNGNAFRRPEQAVEYYKTAIEKGFDTLDLRLEMGNLLRFLKRYDEAVEQLRIAIEMDERDMGPHLSLAYTFLFSGCYEDALKEFDIVKVLDPEDYNDGILSIYIGDCLYEVGRYEEALKEYRAVLRCDCYEDEDANRAKERVDEIERKLKALPG